MRRVFYMPEHLLNISELEEKDLVVYVNARKSIATKLQQETATRYDKNLKSYKNNPEWGRNRRQHASSVTNNRQFDSLESNISFLLSRMSHVNTVPAGSAVESVALAKDVESMLLEKNKRKNIKQARKRAVRKGILSRLFVLKIVWNPTLEGGRGDFEVISPSPKSLYIDPKASSEREAEFIIEDVTERISCLVKRFPDKEMEIIKKVKKNGQDIKDIFINDEEVNYQEAWLDNGRWVCWLFGNIVLDKKENPYWDKGMPFTKEAEEKLKEYPGRRRASLLKETYDGGDSEYYFNHFSEARAPYIFTTIFDTENSPVGETDYMEQSNSLQEDIDNLKRLITNNAKWVNGITKVSESISGLSKAEANRINWYDNGGVLWGTQDVIAGVKRETGEPLPGIVFQQMEHSERALEQKWGSIPVFRGESERQMTAIEASMLRDQSVMTKQELVDAVEYLDYELYNWELQMMFVKYELPHIVKMAGRNGASQIIELSKYELEQGMGIKVITGSLIPEDRAFKMQRAKEELEAGVISPVQYFEAMGDENPKEKAKEAFLFQQNPIQYLGISPEELGQTYPQTPTQQPPMSAMPAGDFTDFTDMQGNIDTTYK